jgi:hypothetical protein
VMGAFGRGERGGMGVAGWIRGLWGKWLGMHGGVKDSRNLYYVNAFTAKI